VRTRAMSVKASANSGFGAPTGFRRLGGRNDEQPALALRGEGQAGQNIVARQLWEIGAERVIRTTGCEIAENLPDRDARAADARLAKPHAGIDADALEKTHAGDHTSVSRAARSPPASLRPKRYLLP
jgi:hypothetical protein